MANLAEPRPQSRPPLPVAAAQTRVQAGLTLALCAIGAGLTAVALLGPLVTGVIDYHVTETLQNQTIGLDLVSLLVVAPLSLLAAVLVLRGHVGGPALALGIGAYTTPLPAGAVSEMADVRHLFIRLLLPGPTIERRTP